MKVNTIVLSVAELVYHSRVPPGEPPVSENHPPLFTSTHYICYICRQVEKISNGCKWPLQPLRSPFLPSSADVMRPSRPAEAACTTGGQRAGQLDGWPRPVAAGIIVAQACYGSRGKRQDGRQTCREPRARQGPWPARAGGAEPPRFHRFFQTFLFCSCARLRTVPDCHAALLDVRK